MVVIRGERTTLDRLLADPTLTLLLLAGGDGSDARAAHDLWEGGTRRPWRKAVLLTDLSVLTAAERRDWLDAGERYAQLCRATKDVRSRGPLADLLRADGDPSIRALLRSFARGDLC